MPQHRTRFNLLQALRFFAALNVVILHSGYYIKVNGNRSEAFLLLFNERVLGYSVFLFFAISGFVLMPTLERSTTTQFLVQRFLRIYPAFWGATCLFAAAHFVIFKEPIALDWRSLILLPLGVLPYPLGVEWSLIYEIFFYLMLAALSLLRSRLLFNLALAFWGLIILVGYFTVGSLLTQPLPTWNIIPFSLMNLSFIAGIVSYQLYSYIIPYRWLLLPVSLVSLCIARFSSDPLLVFSGLAIGCGSLVTFAAAQATVRDLSAKSFLVKLGNYSYGTYLLHVPVLLLIIKLSTPRVSTWILSVLCIILALLVGAIFGWIELRLYQKTKHFITAKKRD
ncbi:acyltransferase [Leptolyngbya sp. FACHB-321]|uniref:acyltransferase family protein n=1 Tax=Leptolyngbya sp. FACHB-321 TaxID=2692807 RepID=UPI001687AF6A|nr:acyltransferase [Leptolyngbya sp. FACHB-321]